MQEENKTNLTASPASQNPEQASVNVPGTSSPNNRGEAPSNSYGQGTRSYNNTSSTGQRYSSGASRQGGSYSGNRDRTSQSGGYDITGRSGGGQRSAPSTGSSAGQTGERVGGYPPREGGSYPPRDGGSRDGSSRGYAGGRSAGGSRDGGRGDNRGRGAGNNDRRQNRREKEAEVQQLDNKVIDVRRVTRVVKGGKRMRFSALVVVGDKNGKVGYAIRKGLDYQDAVAKATKKATSNLIKVEITAEGSLKNIVQMKYKACEIYLKPAKQGTGLIAGGYIRPVLELAGVQNIYSKVLRSRNKIAGVQAVFEALKDYKKEVDIKPVQA